MLIIGGKDTVSDSTAVFEVSDSVEVGKERLSVLKKSDGAHGYRIKNRGVTLRSRLCCCKDC